MKKSFACLVSLAFTPLLVAAPLAQLELADHIGHTWSDELISVSTGTLAPGQARTDALRLVDDTGKTYPIQISDTHTHPDGSLQSGTLWTVVTLPADGKLRLQLEAGSPPAVERPASAKSDSKFITLDNGTGEIAIRLPVSAQAAALKDMPAPFQSLRMANGQWMGKGWFVGNAPIKNFKSEIISNGPLFAEARLTYTGDGDQHYVVKAKVIRGKPVVLVEEEFNFPALQDGPESVEQKDPSNGGLLPCVNFTMSEGFAPDAFRFKGRSVRPEFKAIHPVSPTEEGAYELTLGKAIRNFSLFGFMGWWPNMGPYFTFYRQADDAGKPVVGLFKMNSSRWFNPTGMQVWTDPKLGVYVSSPLGITHRRSWEVDGVHDAEIETEIFTGSFDPSLPKNLGRRAWAFFTAPKGETITDDYKPSAKTRINQLMISLGEFPLEKVKNWTLAWDNAAVKYPRLLVKPEEYAATVERIKAAKPGDFGLSVPNPASAILTAGTPEADTKTITALADSLLGLAKAIVEGGGATGNGTHFFPLGLNLQEAGPKVDQLLASPAAPIDQQRRLMTGLAFLAYVGSDLDYYPMGSGFHLGNPNMPMIVDSGLGMMGCLFPSHPDAKRWVKRGMDRANDRFTRLVDSETGAWEECPHYMVDATFRPCFKMFFALRNSGFRDFFAMPQVKKVMQYHMGIMSPPDPRFGIRMLAPIGDGGLRTSEWLGWAAAAYAKMEPELSAQLEWMWDAAGRDAVEHAAVMVIRPDLPRKTPELRSTWYKGFGAVMRNGFPDPKETWMIYRQGNKISHYGDGDQGCWHLVAKGAPVSVNFGSQYNPRIVAPWLHNRISIDHQADPMILSHHDIEQFITSSACDFVAGQSVIERIGPMDEIPYVSGEQGMDYTKLKPIPPVTWRRSILFVKDKDLLGPNYFVVRDTFDGATKPTDWSCWSLASGVKFEGNMARFTGQCGVDLDVAIFSPSKVEFVQNRDPIPPPPQVMRVSDGKRVADWPAEYQKPAEPHPPIMTHNFVHGNTRIYWMSQHAGKRFEEHFEERQICARVKAGVGEGYFALLYPRVAGSEEIPVYASWAGGQGVSLTFKDGRHLVLAAAKPVKIKADKVEADAATAVVRDRGGKVELDLVRGQRLAYGDFAIEGIGPVTLRSDGRSLQGEIRGDARKVVIHVPSGLARGKTLIVDGKNAGPSSKSRFELTVDTGAHVFRLE